MRLPRALHSGACRLLPAALACGITALSSVEHAQAVEVPSGFSTNTFHSGLDSPTSLAFGPDGYLYVSTFDDRIHALGDLDADGVADTSITFASGMFHPTGLAHDGSSLFVSYVGEVARYFDFDADHVADAVDTTLTNIPAGAGRNYDLTVGPDGWLYMGVGATTNLGQQSHPWSATVLRFTATGDTVEVLATGVRVAYDVAFHESGELFAADNGPSAESTFCYEAPDELNWIRAGEHYGFPDCFGFGDCVDVSAICSPAPCGIGDCDLGGCGPGVTDPLALFDPHASADGLSFGTGFADFGPDDLFVAEFGETAPSGGCTTGFGRRVSHVRLHQNGGSWAADPPEAFATGLGRPLDVAVGPDGALYVADYETGNIERVVKESTGVVAAPNSRRLRLGPNPASGSVRMAWNHVAESCLVEIFDVVGRRVAQLSTRGNEASWNLMDSSGARVSAGVYLARLRCGAPHELRKFVVTR